MNVMLATVIVGAGTIAKIVAWGGGLAAGIVALFLMYGIAKDGWDYAKGQGSVFKILGKVLFLILCIGIIILAINYDKLGNKFAKLAEKGIDVVATEASDVFKG